MPTRPVLRLARPHELERIRQVEDEAGRRFLAFGIDDTRFDGLSIAAMLEAIDDGLLFVLDDGVVVGFALCEGFPHALHLHEIDVLPSRQGQGLGRQLIEHVIATARRRGCARVTLTTYRDIPFNRPLYERFGFAVVAPGAQPSWLAAIRAAEAEAGLDAQPRVAMALDLR